MQTEDKYLVVSVVFAFVVGGILFLGRTSVPSASGQASADQIGSVQALPANATRATLLGANYGQDASARRPYVIVEFGDYQCPPCAALHTRLKAFVQANSGQVGLAFRHYPLMEIHENAFKMALYAEAAREQGKFWQMHDLLYAGSNGSDTSGVEGYAQKLGLNLNAFHKAVETTAKTRVRVDQEAALALNLQSTPTLILCAPDAKPRMVTFGELEQSIH